MAEKWGIWNSIKKEFQFGISEDTPEKANKRLFQKIGKNAYKWRFEVKRIRGEWMGKPKPRKGEKNGASRTMLPKKSLC